MPDTIDSPSSKDFTICSALRRLRLEFVIKISLPLLAYKTLITHGLDFGSTPVTFRKVHLLGAQLDGKATEMPSELSLQDRTRPIEKLLGLYCGFGRLSCRQNQRKPVLPIATTVQ